MASVVVSLLHSLRFLVRSRASMQLEILALRHQLTVAHRSRRPQLRLTPADRMLWAGLSRAWRGWRSALVIAKPETVIAWHRRGFRLFWTWKSRRRTGRPGVPADVRALIRELSTANPPLGCASNPRRTAEAGNIHQPVDRSQVHATASAPAVSNVENLPRQSRQPDHGRRPVRRADRLVHTAVTAHPTATWIAQQLRNAFPHDQVPRYLLHDRDTAFAAVETTIAAMHIEAVRTAPRSPCQNGYVERLIGSIRRECLVHVIVVNELGLRRVLAGYVAYYMRSRTHLALAKDSPVPRPAQSPSAGRIVATPEVGGLHHRYDRLAA